MAESVAKKESVCLESARPHGNTRDWTGREKSPVESGMWGCPARREEGVIPTHGIFTKGLPGLPCLSLYLEREGKMWRCRETQPELKKFWGQSCAYWLWGFS